ncbi:hypothetical protein EV645_6923 [Kribbella rubisoli]|uniref:Uncharacterized protein n=1 Tax=Kribbella rubisoli TaxID=3075929 RepID=A0A4Q7WKH4_9ACTN|nr:hypothetical protein [Kribbella rubisoli]RZU10460.1 hypothetical protein EV645_6923 [Kribbella rubisoli]
MARPRKTSDPTRWPVPCGRCGGHHQIVALGPVPIIADALGHHPSTIERHAIGSDSVYSQYIAARRQMA